MASDITLMIRARNEASAALQAVKGDLQELGRAAGGLGETLSSAGASIRNVGVGMSAAITLPLVGIAGAAVNSATAFEQALNVMQQVSGATGSQMAQLQAQALQLGAATSFSAGEAAAAMLELAKAGLTADEVGQAIAGTMDLAAAGNLNLASAAEIAANAVNVFGLKAGDTTGVANMLAAAANASSVEVTDLAAGMKMAGAVFAASGQSIDDLTTALALMGNAGIQGSDAGTSLKTMLMRLTAPTDDAADALAQLGVTMYDVAGNTRELPAVMADLQQALFGTNAVTVTNSNLTSEQAERMEHLRDAITKTQTKLADYQAGVVGAGLSEQERTSVVDELSASLAAARAEYGNLAAVGGSTATVMRTLTEEQRQQYLTTIFGADAIRAVNVLMAEGQGGWEAMAAAVGTQGAAAAVADARMRGMGGAVEYLKGSVDSFLIGTALPYLDTMSGIVRQVADAITWFGNLDPALKNTALAIAGVLAVAGPLLVAIGMLSSAIGAALPVIGAIGGVIAALASPIGLIVAAVGALGVAFATDFMGMRTAVTQALTPLIAGVQRVRQAFAVGMVTVDGVVKELGATLLGLGTDSAEAEINLQELATILTGSAAAGALFQGALEGIGSVLIPVRTAIAGVIDAFQTFGASGAWANLVATVTGAVGEIGAAIASLFGGQLSVGDFAGDIGAQFQRMAQAVRDAVASADFGSLGAGIVGALGLDNIDLGQLRASLAAFVASIASTITAFDWGGALTTAGDWLAGLTGWVAGQITAVDWGGALATAGDWLAGLTGWIGGQVAAIDWGGVLTTAGDWLGGLRAGVVGAVTAIDWGAGLAAAGGMANGLRDGVLSWLTDAINGVNWSTVSLDFASMIDAVTGSINSIDWSAIKAENVFAALVAPVTAALAGINWLINNESFQGLAGAVGNALMTIDWGAIGGSLVGLGGAVGAAIQGLDWSTITGAFDNLKATAVAAISSIDWGGALAAAGGMATGLRDGVVGAITAIDWGGALPTAGGMATGLRDGVLANLTQTFTGLDLTGTFTGLLDTVTNQISTIDWSGLGSNLASSISSAINQVATIDWSSLGASVAGAITAALSLATNPEAMRAAAIAAFATLAPAVAAGLAGVTWVFSSDNFASLSSAVTGAVTGLDWGAVGASFSRLRQAVVDGLGEFAAGFAGGFTWQWPEWEWPELPQWEWPTWEWPKLPEFKWPSLPEWEWPKLPEWRWPSLPEFSWPAFSWPALPWPFAGGGGGGAASEEQLGTSYFGGGWSWVGEAGRELVQLPRGAAVIPHAQSERLAAGLDRVAVTIQQMIVRDDQDVYSLAYQVADILARA